MESLKSHSIPSQKLSRNSGQVSYFNFATVAFLHFNKGRLRREFERKDFFLSGEYCEETLLLKTDKLVSEIISAGDLQLSTNSERQNIREVNSIKISRQTK